MRADAENTVAAIEKSLSLLAKRMDWETAEHRLEEFNAMTEDPNLWDDPDKAQKLMRDRQMLVDAMARYTGMSQDLRDNVELIELGEMEDDAEVVAEAEAALKALRERAAQAEIEALLDGEADGNDTFLETCNNIPGACGSCFLLFLETISLIFFFVYHSPTNQQPLLTLHLSFRPCMVPLDQFYLTVRSKFISLR